mmetsp:Transcript_99316/g.256822  ORF Transcript_99316/g.256822 Transcript_99316/m.256822 type:complete len:340 (+) Transcript_99316:63-1082(+)
MLSMKVAGCELDRLWQYAGMVDKDGWSFLGSTSEISFFVQDVDGTRLLLNSYSFTPTQAQRVLHAWTNPEEVAIGSLVQKVMVEDLTPDDLLISYIYEKPWRRRMLALWGSSHTASDNCAHTFRTSKRAFFPQSHQMSLAWAQCDASSGDIVSDSERWQFGIGAMVLGVDEGTCKEVLPIPRGIPGWMLGQFVKYLITPFYDHFTALSSLPPRNRYVVVAMKGVRRGYWPLVRSDSGDWQPQEKDTGSLRLASYLNHLLEAFSLSWIKTWSFLDGWQLAPYQAVVLQKDWDAFWKSMGPIWGEMRTAFRSVYGGTHGPKLHIAKNPQLIKPLWEAEALL